MTTPAWQPPPRRPALDPVARRGALLAGGLSFTLISFGSTVLAFVVIAAIIVSFAGVVVSALLSGSGTNAQQAAQWFESVREQVDLGLVIGIGIAVAIVGVVLIVVGLFVSRGILHRRGVDRAWAVTWSGLGIAIVGSWIANSILSIPFQLFTSFPGIRGSDDPVPLAAGISVISFVVTIAVVVASGALSWWWMAHAFRPAGTPAPAAPVTPAA